MVNSASQDSAMNAAPTLTTNLRGGPMAGSNPTKLHANAKDISGFRFGRLRVIEVAHSQKRERLKGTILYWRCTCDCGNESIAAGPDLKKGEATSCGCYHKDLLIAANTKHGLAHSNEYQIWAAMKQRCENPRNAGYRNYGARGIFVSREWSTSFEHFLADMGPRPEGLTIDRIDNDGPYTGPCPDYPLGNCRWATHKEQANNTRRQKR